MWFVKIFANKNEQNSRFFKQINVGQLQQICSFQTLPGEVKTLDFKFFNLTEI